ncbi:MAG: chorismate-binding protein, partial [Gaiellaceae bacterium]
RNDLSRVCAPGTVTVERFLEPERFSHVTHLVSEVAGTLRPDVTPFDLLRARSPAGTVSGAPKVRAMQLISELEGYRRGPYGGAVGYVLPSGELDTCIAIRTIVLHDGVAHLQAGAGIVADSDPAAEHRECLAKLAAL